MSPLISGHMSGHAKHHNILWPDICTDTRSRHHVDEQTRHMSGSAGLRVLRMRHSWGSAALPQAISCRPPGSDPAGRTTPGFAIRARPFVSRCRRPKSVARILLPYELHIYRMGCKLFRARPSARIRLAEVVCLFFVSVKSSHPTERRDAEDQRARLFRSTTEEFPGEERVGKRDGISDFILVSRSRNAAAPQH